MRRGAAALARRLAVDVASDCTGQAGLGGRAARDAPTASTRFVSHVTYHHAATPAPGETLTVDSFGASVGETQGAQPPSTDAAAKAATTVPHHPLTFKRYQGKVDADKALRDTLPRHVTLREFFGRKPKAAKTQAKVPEPEPVEGGALTPEERRMIRAQKEAAAHITAMMFPWERRQMGGGADGDDRRLTTWERIYWALFAAAIVYFAYTRLGPDNEPDPKEERDRATALARRRAARSILAGKWPLGLQVANGEEDPFQGLAPGEIVELVEKERLRLGGPRDDPFEGLTPEEIEMILEGREPTSVALRTLSYDDLAHPMYAMVGSNTPRRKGPKEPGPVARFFRRMLGGEEKKKEGADGGSAGDGAAGAEGAPATTPAQDQG
ncbi:unnamed protein product [Pedinophyceae sp. YPF-701]|nr:unnamed protein product [Pedinophyceae sp. YPF-701]